MKYGSNKIKVTDQRQGPWVSYKLCTEDGLEGVIYQEKWDNTKGILRGLSDTLSSAIKILRKDLL